GKGLYTRDDVEYLHAQMLRHFMLNRIPVTEIYYCPHHPSVSRCICRKPDSLLLEKAIARFRISAKASFFIGDAGRDMEAASRVGVKGIRVEPNSNLAEILPLIP
ncbi:MAG: HAD-IIIA family hydrolase, partial [Bacteroidia bacterium]|nr:HAD-IIIA family hydrolase [Bacteroidia bacterium]